LPIDERTVTISYTFTARVTRLFYTQSSKPIETMYDPVFCTQICLAISTHHSVEERRLHRHDEAAKRLCRIHLCPWVIVLVSRPDRPCWPVAKSLLFSGSLLQHCRPSFSHITFCNITDHWFYTNIWCCSCNTYSKLPGNNLDFTTGP